MSTDEKPVTRRGLPALTAALTMATAFMGCGFSSTTYAEIEVRDPGRVSVGTVTASGVEPVLPPDGSERVVRVPNASGRVLARRGREIALATSGQPPVTLIDERGILPRLPPSSGIELRDKTLSATFNVTPTRVLPPEDRPRFAVPVVLSTEMSNVLDAREVTEVSHTPAYICLPLAILLATLATNQVFFTREETLFGPEPSKVAGGVLYVAAGSLVVYSVINLTSSGETKPLDIPGAKAASGTPRYQVADRETAATR